MRKFTCFSRWANSDLTPKIIDYEDLISKNLSDEILEGFGLYNLGILGVRNIPKYTENRLNLLNLAKKFATLPAESKAEMTIKNNQHFIGWRDHSNNSKDIVNYFKDSFYANPEIDSPIIPGEWADNIWPKKSFPELEPALKTLGKQMIHVSGLVSRQIDQMISLKYKNYKPDTLFDIATTHKNHTSRLIYYYPRNEGKNEWATWHKDFTTLTALTTSMYLNHSTGELISDNEIENPNVGLFVMNRKNEKVKIRVEPDTLLLQVGEIVQILSGGILEATPHGVLNDGFQKGISRVVFAVFMRPKGNYSINCESPENVFIEHEGMISLKGRWEQNITFDEYMQRTVKQLYQ